MSQAGVFVSAAVVSVQTLTGDLGAAVGPTVGNITVAGGNNITTTGTPVTSTLTINLTGTTDHGVQVGNATGSLTSLTVGLDGQVLIGASAADPVFATLTSAGGTVTFTPGAGTLNLEATGTGVNQDNIFYVGKHGNDANDGLNINKAFLTFGAAITAAGAATPAVVVCFDYGTYTENLTGQVGVDIWAPNATIAGVHTLVAGNEWRFDTATIATGVVGFIFNSVGNSCSLTIPNITCVGTGTAAICTAGNMYFRCYTIIIDAGSFFGVTTTGRATLRAGSLDITGAGTAFGIAAAGDIDVLINHIGDAGAGTLIFSTAGVTATVDIEATHIDIENLSNITASINSTINVSNLEGTLNEIGVGAVDRIGGATRIDGVPIGANIASTGDFTTITTVNPIDVAYAGIGVANPTDHAVLVGSGAAAVTPITVGTDGQILTGVTGLDPIFTAAGTGSGLTAHSLLLGQGAGAFTALGAAGDGEIPIGSVGVDPVLATITAGTGINVANAAGSITVSTTGAGLAWTEVVGITQTMAVNNGYITNNAALVTCTLPAVAAVGDVVAVVGSGAGGWAITQNAGQTIHFCGTDTTPGVGGSLASTVRYDCVELICITANMGFVAKSSLGNITIV